MYIQGKVLNVFDIQTGESPRGSWKKREFILETYAKVPKKVCMVIKGDAVDIESREYKEKWYTEIRAWKVEPAVNTSEDSTNTSDDNPF